MTKIYQELRLSGKIPYLKKTKGLQGGVVAIFRYIHTRSGILTVTKESIWSSQPAHDVSVSKTYVLFGMNVTTLLSEFQSSTSLDLSSL